jgi:hypothetical protein
MRQRWLGVGSGVIVALTACTPVPEEPANVTPAGSPNSANARAATTATLPVASPCAIPATPAVGVGNRGLGHVLGLYADGGFVMGLCVLEIPIDAEGRTAEPRFLRPSNPDPRLKKAILNDMSAWRFKPAVACGKRVDSRLTMTITHCPVTTVGIPTPSNNDAADEAGATDGASPLISVLGGQ